MIRGNIPFDPPDRPLRSDAGTGKWNDPTYRREYSAAWRERNREHVRTYNREFMRKYRQARRP